MSAALKVVPMRRKAHHLQTTYSTWCGKTVGSRSRLLLVRLGEPITCMECKAAYGDGYSRELKRQAEQRARLEARAKDAYNVFAHRAGPADYPAFEFLPSSARQAWADVVQFLREKKEG